MKKLITLALLALSLYSAPAAIITGPILDPTTGAGVTTTITLRLTGPVVSGTNLYYTQTRAFTATNGQFSTAQLPGGNWVCQIGPRSDILTFPLPSDTNTYTIAQLLNSGLTFPYPYSPVYLSKVGDVMLGNLSFGLTNQAGLILNQLTTTQRNALTGTNGMLVYDTTLNAVMLYQNGTWTNGVGTAGSNGAAGVGVVAGTGITTSTNSTNVTVNLSTPVTVANGGTGATTARTASSAIGIYQMSPAGGNQAYDDMTNATGIFDSQLGVSSFNNDAVFLWPSKAVGAGGTNEWGVAANFPGGIETIGDQSHAPIKSMHFSLVTNDVGKVFKFLSGNRNFYLNGNTNFWNKDNAWITNSDGSAVRQADGTHYFWEMNPYVSGNAISLPMISTTAVSGTNYPSLGFAPDGTEVRVVDNFGMTLDTIFPSNPYGETNLADSYNIILDGAHPFYISWNKTVGGGNTGQYGLMYIPKTANAINFLYQQHNIWSGTNAAAKNVAHFDLDTGDVDMTIGKTTVNRLLETNRAAGSAIFGDNIDLGAVLTASTSSNSIPAADFNIQNGNGGLAFCASTVADYKYGVGVKAGFYMGEVVASNRYHKWYISSASTLNTDITTQTWTEQAGIEPVGNHLYSLFGFDVTGNITATGSASITGTASASSVTVTNTLTVKAATITSGTGSPNSVVTAPVGSMYLRSDGGAATTLYVKESTSGNTGWVAK